MKFKRRKKYIIIFVSIISALSLSLILFFYHWNNEIDATGLPRKVRNNAWYDQESGLFRCPVSMDSREWSRMTNQEKIDVQSIPRKITSWIPADNLLDLYWNLPYYGCILSSEDRPLFQPIEANKIFEGRPDVAEYLVELYRQLPVLNEEGNDYTIARIEELLERQVIQSSMTEELKKEYQVIRDQKAKEKWDTRYYHRPTFLGDDLLHHYKD
ncbi:hypothetical protein [Anaerolentibacter hominis]|uniref:hypothetical protein n=1 Tax=Anaerolentibacter hominis TaxID=3079009 RepID=UPI0031B8885C